MSQYFRHIVTRLGSKEVWKWVVSAGLALGVLLAPFPLILAALALLLAQLFWASLRVAPQEQLSFSLLTIFLPTVLWYQVAGIWGSGLWALLALPGLHWALQGASELVLENRSTPALGRSVTTLLKSVTTSLALVEGIAALTANPGLALAVGIVASYLLGSVGLGLRRVPALAVALERAHVRIMADDVLSCRVALKNNSSVALRLFLKVEARGIRVEPRTLTLETDEVASLHLTINPPLAGPDQVHISVCALEPQGLVYTHQRVEAAEVIVVPRATVAAWLARAFLTGGGGSAGYLSGQTRTASWTKLREEYSHHRPYLPGDSVRDIDWKRTRKFHELLTKEYGGGAAQRAIVLLDLDAGSAEDADRLALELVTTSLTLAQEGITTTVAAYNQSEAFVGGPLRDAKALVKFGMELLPKLTHVLRGTTVLGMPDVSWLRRMTKAIQKGVQDNGQGHLPAGQVQRLLGAELQALEEMASGHPLSSIVANVIRTTRPPASVLVLSHSSHNQHILAWGLDRLTAAGYRVMTKDREFNKERTVRQVRELLQRVS